MSRNPPATDAEQLEQAIAVAARTDRAIFAEYVLTDEETSAPILNAPCHDRWHALADRHNRMVLLTNVESGKTQTMTVARGLHALGTNPRARILVVSKTKEQAAKIVNAMRGYIERSAELHRVFPHLKPGPVWRYDCFNIDPGDNRGVMKDWNVQSCGMDGAVLGARYSLILIDDLIDFQNTFTDYQRVKTLNWLGGVVFGRLIRNGRILFICNPWHAMDAAHVLGKRKSWHFERSGVVLVEGMNSTAFMALSEDQRRGLPLAWPERWDVKRIVEFIEDFGAPEADRQLFALTPEAGAQLFKPEWIYDCYDEKAGIKREIDPGDLPPGAKIITGVDLASRQGKRSDRTVLFTIMLHPPEPGMRKGKLQLLWIETGKLSSPMIKDKIVDHEERYNGPLFMVEDNGAQAYVKQDLLVEESSIKVHGFTTTAKKWHPSYGLGALAAEFEAHRWIIPAERQPDGTLAPVVLRTDPNAGTGTPDEIALWITEMLTCDPSKHTGDTLMASFFAREGARSPQFQHALEFGATEEEMAKEAVAGLSTVHPGATIKTLPAEKPLAVAVKAAERPEVDRWCPDVTGHDELAELVGAEATAAIDSIASATERRIVRDRAIEAAQGGAPDEATRAAARKAKAMSDALARIG